MTTKIEVDKLNNALQFAVENNNVTILEWVFNHGQPTNINQCILLAIEKNLPEMVTILLAKNFPTQRPLVVVKGVFLDMGTATQKVGDNSQFMVTLVTNPKQALKDLESGVISLEEVNHQNARGWSPLMYLARNVNNIPEVEKLILKLIEMKVDLNLRTKVGRETALILAGCHFESDSQIKIIEILCNQPDTDIKAINEKEQDFIYPLVFNCTDERRLKVEELLQKLSDKINYNTYNKSGVHTVILLAGMEKMMAVEMLLKTGKIEIDLYTSLGAICGLSNKTKDELLILLKKYNALKI